MPFLTRGEVKLFYQCHGTTGTPILLTHGYSSTSAMWQSQIRPFQEAGFRLILWDMRGHGQSSYPEGQSQYSEAHTVADMAALLDEVCGVGSTAIIGGLSLGGYMSLAFHRLHPERCIAVLIIDTGPGFRSDKARDAWNKTAHDTASRFERDGLAVLKEASAERSQVTHRNARGLALAARGM
jgi:pimeloyl-ACP methyl ester carboxylesterase